MKVVQSKTAPLPRQTAPLMSLKLVGLLIPLLSLATGAALAAPAKLVGKVQTQRVSPPVHYLTPNEYVQDEILVMPRGGLEQDDLDESLDAVHGQIKETISNGSLTTYVVHVDKTEFSTAFYKLLKDKNFEVVQCNLLCKMQSAPFPQGPPNDPDYPQQYHLPLLQIPAAWKLSGSGAGATVGIIDSGVDGQETDLIGRVESGLNVITGKPANKDTSTTGHGTAVASLMSASTNNDALGAAPGYGMAIIPTDVFNGGTTATESNVIKAYTYLEGQGIQLICLSINDPLPNSFNNQNAHPALWKYFKDFWNNHNGFTVNSTGNDGKLDTSPRTKYLIVVSAIDANSEPASFTNFGPGISFAAPGVNVGTGDTKNKFSFYSGTSYAAPLVAGIIGEALANNPELTNQQIYTALTTAVTKPPSVQEPYPSSYYYGFGINNAGLLLQSLMK
jgi:subtilisin family serine protease